MLTVYKLDEQGNEVWQYPAKVLDWDGQRLRLEAYFNRDNMDLGFAMFECGDRFVEYFYTDRWYNIFAIYSGDNGRFKGWYCNICRPSEITEMAVRCEDLALDLWIAPNSDVTFLDEDEFAELNLSDYEKARSREAVTELAQMAANGRLPQ